MFILPIERNNPTHSPARLVQSLVACNAIVFAATLIAGSTQVAQQFGFVPASPHLLTLFSHMFLHAGFLHVLGNMFFLWMFGDNVEDVLGHGTFALAYVLCGLGAVYGQYLSGPRSTVPMVGASGAISGVMALYVVFFPSAKFDLDIYLGWWRVASKPASSKVAVFIWFGEQLLLGLITSATHSIGIAFWAHVGGFITGGVLGGLLLALGFKDRYETRIAALRGRTRHATLGA